MQREREREIHLTKISGEALTVVRSVQSIASALLIGLIFLQLERNMSSLSPRLFSSFLLVFAQLPGGD